MDWRLGVWSGSNPSIPKPILAQRRGDAEIQSSGGLSPVSPPSVVNGLCSASFASPRETVDRSVRELQETQHWIGRAVDQSRS